MKGWAAVLLAPPEPEDGPMRSRIPSLLHPVAGRPLIWHSVSSLLLQDNPPREILVVTPPGLGGDLFVDLPVEVRSVESDFPGDDEPASLDVPEGPIVIMHAGAGIETVHLGRLLSAQEGEWLGTPSGEAVALVGGREEVVELLRSPAPFSAVEGMFPPDRQLDDTPGIFRVRNRADLARAHRRIRDGLVDSLMSAGVTFLLPETVMVDVDVRIGRDTMIYPGVTMEGQTTIGEETVVGPGCRIIDSWVGSGVELKGWNYIAHTSVRNRAILEPYVRRGFD
ncbi:MAG: hypothetical protein WD766_07690 [Gemmatimonadota bacterium]